MGQEGKEAAWSQLSMSQNEVKSFQCKLCNFKSSYKNCLKKHDIAIHKKIRPYKCEKCSYSASQSETLNKHVISLHDKSCGYECNLCEHWFPLAHHLKKHVMAVRCNIEEFKEEKSFRCELCNFKTANKRVLYKHDLAVHKKIRPY